MADLGVKMGVSGIAQFKQGMNEAGAAVKTLDAALKANEKQFERSGNAEEHYAAQTTLLNQKLKQQKQIIENAEKALKQMEDNGVKQSSTAYQDMQRKLIEATSAMMDTEAALDSLGAGAEGAAEKTDKLSGSLGGLNRKISLDQVIGAVNSITDGLEKAAKKAVDFGKELWNQIMDSARRADDTATMAEMYGIDLDTFMRMQKLVAGGMDTSVEAILGAQDKLKKGIGSGNKQVMEYMEELGVSVRELSGDEGVGEYFKRDQVELFWEAGQALMAMGDAYDKEAAAQALFGKSWKELIPLFDTYKSLEEYNAALAEQTVNSEETIRDLAALNDAVSALESSWTTLKDEVLGALAPALKGAAESLDSLLGKILEYLKTPEGQQALQDMSTAVSGLFEDLGKIDPESVVDGFTKVFNGIVTGLQWLVDNKGAVEGALTGIVGAWGGMKIGYGVLTIIKLIDGLRDLGVIGGGAAGAAAGAGTGVAGTAASGGLMAMITNALNGIIPGIAEWVSQNGGPVMDWLTHESPVGSVIQGTETWDQWWERQKSETQQRTETFTEDWKNNEIVKFFGSGVDKIKGDVENTRQFWQGIFSGLREADKWNFGDMSVEEINKEIEGGEKPEFEVKPVIPKDWNFGDEYTSEELREILFGDGGEEQFGEAAGEFWKGIFEGLKEADEWNFGDMSMDEIMEQITGGREPEFPIKPVIPKDWNFGDEYTSEELWDMLFGEKNPQVEVDPKTKGNAAEDIAEQVGEVEIPARLTVTGFGSGGGGSGWFSTLLGLEGLIGGKGFANGLPMVPFDGYYMLHKGETVTTARQVERESRNYSSNLYVESMYMNNGTDAEGLAAAMAAAQRRTSAGFGS